MIRRFEKSDAKEVSELIARILRETNIKDYSTEYIENDVIVLNFIKNLVITIRMELIKLIMRDYTDWKNFMIDKA